MDCSESNGPAFECLSRYSAAAFANRLEAGSCRLFVLLLLAISAATAHVAASNAAEAKDAGLMFKSRDGEPLRAPTLMTDVDIAVTGIIARVRVTQRFYNPTDAWQEGI